MILKQAVGIDVAQMELVVCLGRITASLKCELYARKTFANNKKGFEALVKWVDHHTQTGVRVLYVM